MRPDDRAAPEEEAQKRKFTSMAPNNRCGIRATLTLADYLGPPAPTSEQARTRPEGREVRVAPEDV